MSEWKKQNQQTLILKFRVERFSFWFSSIDKKPPYHWIPLYWYLWMNGWWWSSSSISSMICNGIDCRLFFHFWLKKKRKKIIVYISILCFATLIRFFVRQIHIVCACVWMWNGWIEIARDDDDKKYEDIESRESKESKESKERENPKRAKKMNLMMMTLETHRKPPSSSSSSFQIRFNSTRKSRKL